MERLGITLKCLVIPWDQTVIPITPHDVVQLTADVADAPRGPGRSGSYGRQPGGASITRRHDCFQRHVAGALDGPFVILFQQDSAHKAGDGGLIWEEAASSQILFS